MPIYPPFFLLFSLLGGLYTLRRGALWNRQALGVLVCFGGLFLLGCISHLTHEAQSTGKYLFKLGVNFSFLATTVLLFRHTAQSPQRTLLWLERILVVILALSVLQVLRNAWAAGMLLTPLQGRVNSAFADLITEPGVFWGIKEKNMWALKLAFTTLALVSIRRFGCSALTTRQFAFALAGGLFCVIWTFSRTAQLIVLVPMLYLALHHLLTGRSRTRKLFYAVLAAPFFFAGLALLYQKLFAVSLSVAEGDGLATRFVIWIHFWKLLPSLDLWTGNGLLFGKNVLPAIDRFEIYFHNVFMDVLADYGVLGLLSLGILYWQFYFRYPKPSSRLRWDFLLLLFFPVFLAINSQAMFLEVDIVLYMSFAILCHEAVSRPPLPEVPHAPTLP